jgi:hypothetical protein
MTADKMIYEFELSADKVSSKNAMNLSLPAKLAYLNRGQRSLILTRYGGSSNTREAFEENRKRRDELQYITVLDETLPVQKISDSVYQADLTKTKHKYLLLVGQYGHATKDKCHRQRITIKDTRVDGFMEALNNPFQAPNFRWRRALMRTGENLLNVYTDGFVLDALVIDYMRHPRAINVTGWTDLDGTQGIDVSCELPEMLHDEVVSQAVANFKADLGDPAYQMAAYKAQPVE